MNESRGRQMVCTIDIATNCAAHTNTLQTTKVDTQIYCCKLGEITNWISNADLQTLRKLRKFAGSLFICISYFLTTHLSRRGILNTVSIHKSEATDGPSSFRNDSTVCMAKGKKKKCNIHLKEPTQFSQA